MNLLAPLYRLSDRLARFFGVWREADSGCRIVFDPLFATGTALPAPGDPPLSICRGYSPVHNIGHFRFLECSHRSVDGAPGATAERMKLRPERVMVTIHKYGNTTAATIPLCLWDYESKLKVGDRLILAAFGGGFTWGGAYLTWAYDSK